ncbi:MAG: FtsW/RodA/SpoVE family cell cycle protein [Lachnospiraceae bacterium]|nr:FtsW/RodA/SpoVE family cell cycle protein [Lachnospiraceae bacterium]
MLFIILFLILTGLVILYSTSSYEAAIDFNGDSMHYLRSQAMATALGLFFMLITTKIPVRLYDRLCHAIYGFSLLLVILVRFIGTERNGAKRWIYIGPVSLQPAEISKIAVIVITAHIICRMDRRKLRTFRGLIMVMLPSLAQAVAIYVITKNLSSAIIVVAIAAGMVFVASRGYKWFVFGAAGIGAAAYAIVTWIIQNGGNGNFRGRRILAWRDPAAYADSIGFQTLQALYGIGSGGIFGKGLGESMQKLGFIPEAQNDMIFSIICEELGLFGAISIIVLFMILTWRFMVIAMNARDLYSSLLVVGVMTHIAVQVILNIAVVTNTIPNTGISLPFISFGGSSVLFLLIEVGVVLRVMRDIRQES